MGGTLAKALTDAAPPKAMDRMRRGPHIPLAARADMVTRYSAVFLGSIDKALVVEESERWQNAGEWLAALQRRNTVNQGFSMSDRSARTPLASNKKIKPMHWILAGCVILGLGAWAMIYLFVV